MQAKMKGPKKSSGLSHDGISYAPDADGIVTLPIEAVADAMSHGFTLVSEAPAADPSTVATNSEPAGDETPPLNKMTKVELVTFAKAKLGIDLVPDTMTKAAMIAQIEAARAA